MNSPRQFGTVRISNSDNVHDSLSEQYPRNVQPFMGFAEVYYCMNEIVSEAGVMGGQPRIEGRRISVLQIVEWIHEEGMDPETVATEFDLDLADISRALAYYYDNVQEMSTWRDRREERIRESKRDQPDPDSVTETA